MKRMKGIYCSWILYLLCFLSSIHFSIAQTGIYNAHGWQLLKGNKTEPAIVALIDGGLDTAHEDLTGHIWTNTKEIPGNGIDDDHNGYVDDIHGWNFLGGKNGKNILIESHES